MQKANKNVYIYKYKKMQETCNTNTHSNTDEY